MINKKGRGSFGGFPIPYSYIDENSPEGREQAERESLIKEKPASRRAFGNGRLIVYTDRPRPLTLFN